MYRDKDGWHYEGGDASLGGFVIVVLICVWVAAYFILGSLPDGMETYVKTWNEARWDNFATPSQMTMYEVMFYGAKLVSWATWIPALWFALLAFSRLRGFKPFKDGRWVLPITACFLVLWFAGRIFVSIELNALKAAIADRPAREQQLAAQIALNREAPQKALSPEEGRGPALLDEQKRQAFLKTCTWADFPDKEQYPWLADVQKAELEKDGNWRERLKVMQKEHRDSEFRFTMDCLGNDPFIARDCWQTFSPNLKYKLMQADRGQAKEFMQQVVAEYYRKHFPVPDQTPADVNFDIVPGAKPPASKSIMTSGADGRLDGSPAAKQWFASLEAKWDGFLKGEPVEDTAEIELAEIRDGFTREVKRLLPHSPYLNYREFPEALRDKLADGEWDMALMFLKWIEAEYRRNGYASDTPRNEALKFGQGMNATERKALETRTVNWRQEKKQWFGGLDARWKEYANQEFEFNYKTLRALDFEPLEKETPLGQEMKRVGMDAKTMGQRFRSEIRIIARQIGRDFDPEYLERDEGADLNQPPEKQEPPEHDAASPKKEDALQTGTAKDEGRKRARPPSDAELWKMMLKIRNPGTGSRYEKEFLAKLNKRDRYRYWFEGTQLTHELKAGETLTLEEANSFVDDGSFDPLEYEEQSGRFLPRERNPRKARN